MTARGSPDESDEALLPRLLARDERAFRAIVGRHHRRFVAVARASGLSEEAAEDTVQDAWLVIMRGLDGFQGRSSLQTWMIGIVINLARRTGSAARRTRPFADFERETDADEPALPASRFLDDGHWATPPWHWTQADLEDALASKQLRRILFTAMDALPQAQRLVLRLRDVEGLSASGVEGLVGWTEAHQRLLLSRARVGLHAVVASLLRSPRP